MSAVMKQEVSSTQWRGLEPEGRGHELLQTWAFYRRGGERSHSPYVSGQLSEPLAKGYDGEPDEVIRIDRILAVLNLSGHWQSVEVVKRYYLSETSIPRIASDMERTAGFVRLTLRGIAGLVESRIEE